MFYAFFPFLWIKMLPSFSHSLYHSSISLHLVGPTCLSLICLPCTISHFSPSVKYLLAYYTTSPIPPSIALAPFFSLSLTHSSLALSFSSSITFWHLAHQLFHSSHLSSRQIKFRLSAHYNIVEKGRKERKKINRFKQTNQSSGNSLFVPKIKISNWLMNTLTLQFLLNESLSLRLWAGSTQWTSIFAASLG